MSEFRVGVSTPGHRQGAAAGQAEEERVPNDDPRQGISRVSELVLRADIPGSVDPRVGGLQPIVDLDALLVVLHSGRLQPHALDVGRPAAGQQNLVHAQVVVPAVRVNRQPFAARVGADPQVLAAAQELDAVAKQGAMDDLCGLRVLLRQDAMQGLDQVDLAPETSERLGQLAADRAGADHRQTPGEFGQAEHRLVR